MGAVGNTVQQRLAKSRIGKHARPFRERQVRGKVKPYNEFPAGPGGYQKLDSFIRKAYPNADRPQYDPARWPQQ